MLPVFFELYSNYLTNCNYEHELIMGNPQYRLSLDSKLPDTYFDNPRTITQMGSQGIPTNSSAAPSQPSTM